MSTNPSQTRPEGREQDQPSSTTARATPRSSSRDVVTGQGRTSIADSVVQKIASIATREVSGVYSLGAGAARAFGAIRERIPGSSGPNLGQGVAVEVGERQAAIDLDIVVEYGVAISELAAAIRGNVVSSVERMTGLEVTEVNISVDDIHLPGEEKQVEPARVE